MICKAPSLELNIVCLITGGYFWPQRDNRESLYMGVGRSCPTAIPSKCRRGDELAKTGPRKPHESEIPASCAILCTCRPQVIRVLAPLGEPSSQYPSPSSLPKLPLAAAH